MEQLGGDLFPILDLIEKEKGIIREMILKLIKNSIVSAFKKHNNKFFNVQVKLGIDGVIELYSYKNVVNKVSDSSKEISFDEAKEIDKKVKVGDNIRVKTESESFGRIAAQTAKLVIIQYSKDEGNWEK